MRITKTYTSEFKLDAIRRARENKNINATARELGIAPSLLSHWIRQQQARGAAAFPGKGKESLTELETELKRLRKENEVLRLLDPKTHLTGRVAGA